MTHNEKYKKWKKLMLVRRAIRLGDKDFDLIRIAEKLEEQLIATGMLINKRDYK